MLHNRLTKLREKREEGDNGFTLIELLVVVVIIGILIAIAIPLYLNYKEGANDKAAQSDLRNAVSTLELCQSDNNAYPDYISSNGDTMKGCDSQKLNLSSGTSISYFTDGDSGKNYLIESTNSNGSGKTYCYASASGGSVKAGPSFDSYQKSCDQPN